MNKRNKLDRSDSEGVLVHYESSTAISWLLHEVQSQFTREFDEVVIPSLCYYEYILDTRANAGAS
jgi:hypothetical protein